MIGDEIQWFPFFIHSKQVFLGQVGGVLHLPEDPPRGA